MTKQLKNYFGFVRDRSKSMRSIAPAAMNDYNSMTESVRKEAINNQQDTIVSVMDCGVVNYRATQTTNEFDVKLSSVLGLRPMDAYPVSGNNTPLYDAVFDLIEHFKAVPDANNPNVSFILIITTDGADNASKHSAAELGAEIARLQNTDRWSFIFRVPKDQVNSIKRNLKLASGNVIGWDQTDSGVEESRVETVSGISNFYEARSKGATSTRSFYTDMSGVKAKDVVKKLTDISTEVTIWDVLPRENDCEIRDFVEKRQGTGEWVKGAAFYELMKTERRVQSNKLIVIQNKKTKEIFGGAAARDVLGLPSDRDVRLVPGDHGNFTVYVQSKSTNRKLPSGTKVLYWPKFAA